MTYEVMNVVLCWCIAEPVLGAPADMEAENNDGVECHQMVMAWTLKDWKVNAFCKLQFVTELTKDDQVHEYACLLAGVCILHSGSGLHRPVAFSQRCRYQLPPQFSILCGVIQCHSFSFCCFPKLRYTGSTMTCGLQLLHCYVWS